MGLNAFSLSLQKLLQADEACLMLYRHNQESLGWAMAGGWAAKEEKRTWPLPCLERPLFLLFFDMLGNADADPCTSELTSPCRPPAPPQHRSNGVALQHGKFLHAKGTFAICTPATHIMWVPMPIMHPRPLTRFSVLYRRSSTAGQIQ